MKQTLITLLAVAGLLSCSKSDDLPKSYYAKNNWNCSETYTWLDMERDDTDGHVFYLDSVVYGGNGIYINSSKSDADAMLFVPSHDTIQSDIASNNSDNIKPAKVYYYLHQRFIDVVGRSSSPVTDSLSGSLAAGDTISLVFDAEKKDLSAIILGKKEIKFPGLPEEYIDIK